MYHSWECGANKNTISLIRRYIAQETDFNELTDPYVQRVEIYIKDADSSCRKKN